MTAVLQHVNIKILAGEDTDIDLADVIPVFHRWIQQQALEELLIDVADYRHVPSGPGVLLIAHEANYSMDNLHGRLGLLYNRKLPSDADPQATLAQAMKAALSACQRLEEEDVFKGQLSFKGHDVLLILNDRLIHPNTDRGLAQIQAALHTFFEKMFDGPRFTIQRISRDPRERLTLAVRAAKTLSLNALLARLHP